MWPGWPTSETFENRSVTLTLLAVRKMWVVWFQTIPILKGPPSMMLPIYLLLVRLFIASDRRNTLGVPAVPGALGSSFTHVMPHSSPVGIVTPSHFTRGNETNSAGGTESESNPDQT